MKRKDPPDKHRREHGAVARAVKDGRLVRQPCGVCGNPNTHAHHSDYSKPLDVQWLCPTHHMALHRRYEQETRGPRQAAFMRNKYHERVKAGLCHKCGRKRGKKRADRTTCLKCGKKESERLTALYWRRRANQ